MQLLAVRSRAEAIEVIAADLPSPSRLRRRRRPSGAPQALPHHIGGTGRTWIVLSVALVAVTFAMLKSPAVARAIGDVDVAVLRWFAGLRTGWLTTISRGVDRVVTGWTLSAVTLAMLVVVVAFRRWRHLFTFLGMTVVLQLFGLMLIAAFQRPGPFGVTTIGRWQGFALPSATVAVVAATAAGIVYMLVPAGRPRTIAKSVATVVIAVVSLARLVLGIDHPFDVLVGAVIGIAVPLVAFRRFVPNDHFPVTYRPGKTAHLDVGGRRGEALVSAIRDQLGIEIDQMKPVGLAGSGGSTPLRMRVAGEPDTFLFGKLYAMNHVRSDRWYKLGRSVLYGRLEDESPFQSVRRLVEYEDYTLRVMRDAGVATPEAYGIVEVTPEREYLLVTGFVDGSVEIGDADVDDGVIDEGLTIVRQLWNAGLAHRDIKPANLLVKDGHVVVIDVAFAQVRPSPWRQAVDLANMMLVLAVRSDTGRVYRRALLQFTPEEIAEAFAATRGIASPSQLRAVVKTDGRDLMAEFRALAPHRDPISLQRWSVRRVAVTAGLLALSVLTFTNLYQMYTPAELPIGDEPSCGTTDLMVLIAQSVPTAAFVPCVSVLPAGWEVGGVHVQSGSSTFWLDSDRAGDHAVEVTLRPRAECRVGAAIEVPSDEPGVRRYERRGAGPPDLTAVRTYVGAGECTTYRFDFEGDASPSTVAAIDMALGFQPRAELVDAVEHETGLALCGAIARAVHAGLSRHRSRSTPTQGGGMSPFTYSVRYTQARSRLSVAFRGVLAIPHVVMWAFWSWLAHTLAFVQWFVIVVTGERNEGIFEAQRIAMGYMTRALGYATLLFDDFPTLRPVADPSTGEFETPFQPRADRLSNGLRLILMIPAVLLSILVGIVQIVVASASWVVIIVSGRHPEGLWSVLARCVEFNLRLQAYALLMTDSYPRYGDGGSRSIAPSFGGGVLSARGGTH